MTPLEVFALTYAIVSFAYLIYRYSSAIVENPLHWKRYSKNYTPSVSVIIPAYNEEKGALEASIRSICENDYPDKEIIVVDDGSSDPNSWKIIQSLKDEYEFTAIRLPKNMGKRHAMGAGFRVAKNEVMIIMDSDTVVTKGSLRKLVQPLQDPKVGAVSGCIEVRNKDVNFITKIQDARYWLAFQIEKASQNAYDGVTCTSGPFSAYRKSYLMKYLDNWQYQKFLGIECTYGDDRGLTTFMLRQGYKVKFVKDAVAETDVPEKLGKFIKQQIRWKKSFCRENWYMFGMLDKLNPFMIFEFIMFWFVFTMGFLAKAVSYTLIVMNPQLFGGFIAMLVFVGMLHYLYMIIRKPGLRGAYGIAYGLLNEFLFSWLIFVALFNLRDSKWGTR